MADNDVRIKLSMDGADSVKRGLRGVGNSASEASSKLGSLASGGIRAAGTAFAGLAASGAATGAALTGSALKSFAAYEQNIGGIETLFGNAAKKMEGYADEAYKTAGLGANAYMEQVTSFSAALLQGLDGDTDKAADVANKAMIDMSDNANKFGSNIQDIQNAYQGFAKQNFTMLDNLKLGYGGTKEEMARLLNDSGVLGDSFVATAKNLDEVSFDKIIEGIHVVQENMGIAGTTSKEATETISGSIGMLKGSFDNLLTGLGRADADVGKLAGNVLESLEVLFNNVTPVIENIGKNMETLGPKLGDMMQSLVTVVGKALPVVVKAGGQIIAGVVKGIGSSSPKVARSLIPVLNDLAVSLLNQIPALAKSADKMIKGLIKGIDSSAPGLLDAFLPAITSIGDLIVNNLPLLLSAGVKMITSLGEGVVAAIPELIPRVVSLIDGLVGMIKDNLPKVLETAVKIISSLATGLINALPDLLRVAGRLVSAIAGGIIQSIPTIIEAVFNIVKAVVSNVPSILASLLSALGEILVSLVTSIGDSIPNFVEAGERMVTALIISWAPLAVKLKQMAVEAMIKVVSAFTGYLDSMKNLGARIVSSYVAGVRANISRISNVFNNIKDGIRGIIGGFSLNSAGSNLVIGLWNGIVNRAQWLYNKLSNWADSILNTLYDSFGIHSPSRVMKEKVGKNLVLGMAEGISDNSGTAVTAVNALADKTLKAAGSLRSRFGEETSKITGDFSETWKDLIRSINGSSEGSSGVLDIFGKGASDRISEYAEKVSSLVFPIKRVGHILKQTASIVSIWDATTTSGFSDLKDKVSSFVDDSIALLYERSGSVVAAGKDLLMSIGTKSEEVALSIEEKVSSIVNAITDRVGSQIGTMEHLGRKLFSSLSEGIQHQSHEVATIVRNNLINIRNQVDEAVSYAQDQAGNYSSEMISVGENMAEGLYEGLSEKAQWLGDQVRDWTSGIVNNVKGHLGIHSPSRVFRDQIGVQLPAGAAKGIEEGTGLAVNSLKKMNESLIRESSKLKLHSYENSPTPFVPLSSAIATSSHQPTPSTENNYNNSTINSPLITIEHVSVRNEQDIRKLSEQLKRDMTRELRAQGVLA